MKVLIATPIYPPDIGGPATYTKLLERELNSRGISVFVETLNRISLPFVIKHIYYFLRLLMVARRSDIVYAQSSNALTDVWGGVTDLLGAIISNGGGAVTGAALGALVHGHLGDLFSVSKAA